MDGAPHISTSLKAVAAQTLPIEKMVVGMQADEAVALVQRVFNLCRNAQIVAFNASLGLPLPSGASELLAQEVLRDHVVKIALKWPQHLDMPPLALPSDWQANPEKLRLCLFGQNNAMPRTLEQLNVFFAQKTGVGAVLAAVAEAFAPGQAVTSKLQIATPKTVMQDADQENSVATRQADKPLMQVVETKFGRGPLWRALAVALDIESCLNKGLPALAMTSCGACVVPAARGYYAVKAQQLKGRIQVFRRVTPTDHLLARNGVMAQSLSTLSCDAKHPKAQLLVDILDPCIPVTLKEVSYA